ncbi:LOW QUALITY PROTEIN: ankyrin repeat domain-containing protein 13C-like [Uloborus diversus]|uniref:LOW QUALITY PROTEIN: ankyrin repeat domain-containing protein 13C-like n=1 Tax=Uloborus diversus TaxID=327109 RepID=UPI00240A1E66|nr:LOW QUALITY PROTEIN: ankyrin repeat domain-containing protein 13C-like [Uloborus diversus]
MSDNSIRYELHECVFKNDVRKVAASLRTHDVAQKDMHGNTPLHIAIMKGHKECVQLLLAHNAPVKVKNKLGWSPIAEAISFGDRQTISSLIRKMKLQSREAIELRRPDLIMALSQMGDFFMELKWDFQSWVPLVSRILPSDICRIHKKGSNIRLDTTLVDFSDMKWERGDISFLFVGDAKPSQSLVVLDNKLKVFQKMRYEETEAEIEDEVDILMSSDVVAAQISTKSITFSRAQCGWLFRGDRTEMIGHFLADVYIINGLILESRKRREHLTDEDLHKNKAIFESFTKSGNLILDNSENQRRKSLAPPKVRPLSWEEYINSDKYLHIGRPMICKETEKHFKATLAMSEDFPLSVESLLNVLEVIAPFKHFKKLRDFVQMKLPVGFPVKIDIPILPTVTACITFQDFQFSVGIPDSYFEIPTDYQEDPSRFPDL